MIMLFHSFMLPVLVFYKDNPEMLHDFIDRIPLFFTFIFGFDKGVDIFFILSAYLLTSQLLFELINTNGIKLLGFFIRRAFRIMPLFLLGILLYLPLYSDWHPRIVHNLLFMSNFYNDTMIAAGWSLCIEVQFYIVLPFVVLFIHHINNYKALFLGSLLIISLVVRYFITINHPELFEAPWVEMLNNSDSVFDSMATIYKPTHTRFGLLVLGMVWAYFAHSQRSLDLLKKISKTWASAIFLGALLLIVFSLQFPAYHQASWYYQIFSADASIWWITLHRTIFGMAIIVIAVLLDLKVLPQKLGQRMRSVLSHPLWRVPAQLSYPLYLFHIPVILLIYMIGFRTMQMVEIVNIQFWHVIVVFVCASIVTLILAILLNRLIEYPLIQKGKALTRNK